MIPRGVRIIVTEFTLFLQYTKQNTMAGGGGSGDSHSQVRHWDCRKPKTNPLWLIPCSFLLRVCLLVR